MDNPPVPWLVFSAGQRCGSILVRRVARSFVGATMDPALRRFVLIVRYEERVCEPQRWTRRMAEHCGLAVLGDEHRIVAAAYGHQLAEDGS